MCHISFFAVKLHKSVKCKTNLFKRKVMDLPDNSGLTSCWGSLPKICTCHQETESWYLQLQVPNTNRMEISLKFSGFASCRPRIVTACLHFDRRKKPRSFWCCAYLFFGRLSLDFTLIGKRTLPVCPCPPVRLLLLLPRSTSEASPSKLSVALWPRSSKLSLVLPPWTTELSLTLWSRDCDPSRTLLSPRSLGKSYSRLS